MYWSRFHSTNRHGPVPTGAAANAWSPTFSRYLPGTIANPASRPMSAGKGFSVIKRTVSASTICTVLTPCSWPPNDSFFAGSNARWREYFTSSAVSASPLWNLTLRRSLNSSTVSETHFHEVASAGSRSPFAVRWTSLSKMLPLTREAFSSSTWGSKENGRFLKPRVTVSLGWAADEPEVAKTSATARTKILIDVPPARHRRSPPSADRLWRRLMPTASLSLLGGFDARLDSGATLTLPTHKYKALLAFLAVPAGQMHPRDRLVALLWGDRSHDQGRTALRQAVWVLRKALNDATSAGLVIDGDLIGVDPAGVTVDVGEFERAAANGAPIDLERAAALYRGEFLAGVAARETPFEEWLTVQRERLGELALQALARLLAHQRKTGALEAAAQTALRLLSLDPLEESVHRVLMQTYMDLGRRAAALRQYQACVTVLQREIGTEPDAETRALYRAIVSQRVASAVQSPPRASATDRHAHAAAAAPEMTAPFIGRRLEMTLIHEALDESIAGRGQIAVILGEAGMGKSRLVEALGAEAAGRGARV